MEGDQGRQQNGGLRGFVPLRKKPPIQCNENLMDGRQLSAISYQLPAASEIKTISAKADRTRISHYRKCNSFPLSVSYRPNVSRLAVLCSKKQPEAIIVLPGSLIQHHDR